MPKFCFIEGKTDEGLAEIDKALELDPFSMIINGVKGYMLNYAGKTEESIAQLKKTADLYPDAVIIHNVFSQAYANKKIYPEAVEQFLIAQKLVGKTELVKEVETEYKRNGWNGFWQKIIESELKNERSILEKDKDAYINYYNIATYYAHLKDTDKTLEYLNKAFEEREPRLTLIKMAPFFGFLRDDPRFQELLKKVGFPE